MTHPMHVIQEAITAVSAAKRALAEAETLLKDAARQLEPPHTAAQGEGLKQPVRRFEDTFSAETVVMETFFPDHDTAASEEHAPDPTAALQDALDALRGIELDARPWRGRSGSEGRLIDTIHDRARAAHANPRTRRGP